MEGNRKKTCTHSLEGASTMTKFISFRCKFFLAVFAVPLILCSNANAQKSGTSAEDIEGIFNQDTGSAESSTSETPATALDNTPPVVPVNPAAARNQSAGGSPAGEKKLRVVTDLAGLEPLADIAVIQKRFLPKTGRFELFLAGTTVLNDVFFFNYGLQGRFAYYFQERFGIEFTGTYLANSKRDSVKGLLERGIQTQSFVTPKNYYGLDFKWSPIYGKMTWLNKSIVPFDMYFSLGLGSTSTGEAGTDPTLHFGSGQIFAITKSTAFRWDVSLNSFYAKSLVQGGSSTLYNNLLISLGMSFFFPEATYR